MVATSSCQNLLNWARACSTSWTKMTPSSKLDMQYDVTFDRNSSLPNSDGRRPTSIEIRRYRLSKAIVRSRYSHMSASRNIGPSAEQSGARSGNALSSTLTLSDTTERKSLMRCLLRSRMQARQCHSPTLHPDGGQRLAYEAPVLPWQARKAHKTR